MFHQLLRKLILIRAECTPSYAIQYTIYSYRKYIVFVYRLPSSLSQRVDPVKTVSASLRWAAGGAPKMKGLDRFMPR